MRFADELERRQGLKKIDCQLPLAVSALLNPIFGQKPKVVGSGLMTEYQFDQARKGLNHKMQICLQLQINAAFAVSDSSSCDEKDSDDESVPAYNELCLVESWKKYNPDIEVANSRVLFSHDEEDEDKIKEIQVGHVKLRGKDWPSGKNMAEYIDKTLFDYHNPFFHVLFLVVQCNASRCVVEVGFKRFFGFVGYISHPGQTWLGVRTFERLAMFAKCVAKESLRRWKAGAWKAGVDMDPLNCWNLERIFATEMYGNTSQEC
ncbi:hypothetical protein ACHAWX_003935 [Stephanocyclus meneghinianus]